MLADLLDAEEILAASPAPAEPGPFGDLRGAVQQIGSSRAGRPVYGYRFGTGPLHVSLIAGCHADEPVGPAMLEHFAGWLATLPDDAAPRVRASWFLVPHVNPDGEAANAAWTASTVEMQDHLGVADRGYALETYRAGVVRELPGDDLEFGFPSDDKPALRPENRAVAGFLKEGAPFALHASFHGMAYAAGPWFLLEAAWADRTREMRDRLRAQVEGMGLGVHDVDRRGEKGFFRIDRGFTTRPDSRAMVAHFEDLGDSVTAALFRPSSMELVRAFGGDPLTLVSEMPLFLRASPESAPRPMAIRDQMRLQLAFLKEGLAAVEAFAGGSPS